MTNDRVLAARLECVGRTWTPQQRLHPGDVAWAHAHGDGSPAPDRVLTWGNANGGEAASLAGFADIWLDSTPATASLHVSQGHPADRAVRNLLEVVPHVALEVSVQDAALISSLTTHGFHRQDGPWFARLWRSLDDLSDLAAHVVPDGYSVRPMPPPAALPRDELLHRVEVHRRCWAPARIRRLLGLPGRDDQTGSVTRAEGNASAGHPAESDDRAGSGYSVAKHLAVLAAPIYRPELDVVAVAADGSLAAYALGWLDPISRSVLFEPVGTTPEHSGRGLARALCAEVMRVARELGAAQAVVSPRGDDGYPVPRRLYEGLGMREVAHIVTVTT